MFLPCFSSFTAPDTEERESVCVSGEVQAWLSLTGGSGVEEVR